jgi:phospholipid transport system substrate-binding protein
MVMPFVILIMAILLPGISMAAEQKPTAFVSDMADEVILVLKQDNLSDDNKIDRIEGIADRRFHFPSIARLVAARNWKRMTTAQKKAFSKEFQKHLGVTYGKNISRFDDQTIVITNDREEPRGDWTVKTKIVQPGGDDFFVDYRLRKIKGSWRVIDVVVEHISLVANFRSQVQELFSKRGLDETLIFLAEKNASGQSILPPDETTPSR